MPLALAPLLQLEHTLSLVDLAAYLVATEGVLYSTEREYRRMRRLGRVSEDVPIPDLVIRSTAWAGDVFVEFEASAKTTSRYRAILSRYAMNRQPVRFYCLKAGARTRLQVLIGEMGLGRLASAFLWNAAEEVAS